MSRSEQQLALLKERHHELRHAAQTAKKDGDLQMAKDYLRLSLVCRCFVNIACMRVIEFGL